MLLMVLQYDAGDYIGTVVVVVNMMIGVVVVLVVVKLISDECLCEDAIYCV